MSDLRHKVEVDLGNIEERSMMVLDKHWLKLTAGLDGDVNLVANNASSSEGGTGEGSGSQDRKKGFANRQRVLSSDLDDRFNMMKEEMKKYAERVVLQTSEKLLTEKNKSEMLLEGRANAFTIDLERKLEEKLRLFNEEIKIAEADRNLRVKDLGLDIRTDMGKIKSDIERKDSVVDERQDQIKRFFDRSLKDSIMELTSLVDKKMLENEVVVRKLLLKGGGSDALKDGELRALKEKNLLEYVDTLISNLKHEIMTEVEDERVRKNNRLDEVTRLVQTHKNLLDEHITQQGESLKALLKAN